jgi:uncharacterized membrane protein YdjX (TVP38/TMEM64 family)
MAWRALVFLLLCGALALLASSDEIHSLLMRAITAVGGIIQERPVLGAVLFVLLAAASAMLAFFSSAVLVPVVVYTWGKTLCMLALWAGWTLGGMASYGIGRSLGRPVVKSLLSSSTLSRYETRLSRQTPFGLVLLFQLALPSEVPGYLLGLARYPFRKYLAALMLAELPYAVGTVYLGAGFLDRRLPVLLGAGAAVALFMALAFHALHRRLRTD